MEEFVRCLKSRGIAMMMINAGKPVDIVSVKSRRYSERGDVLIDGGILFFTDTQRARQRAEGTGIPFCRMGVSGGEKAR